MELSKKDALMCVCIRVSVPVRYLDLKTRRNTNTWYSTNKDKMGLTPAEGIGGSFRIWNRHSFNND